MRKAGVISSVAGYLSSGGMKALKKDSSVLAMLASASEQEGVLPAITVYAREGKRFGIDAEITRGTYIRDFEDVIEDFNKDSLTKIDIHIKKMPRNVSIVDETERLVGVDWPCLAEQLGMFLAEVMRSDGWRNREQCIRYFEDFLEKEWAEVRGLGAVCKRLVLARDLWNARVPDDDWIKARCASQRTYYLQIEKFLAWWRSKPKIRYGENPVRPTR